MIQSVDRLDARDPLARLRAMRRHGGAVLTRGLPDATITAFLARDPALAAAIERASEEFRTLEETLPGIDRKSVV